MMDGTFKVKGRTRGWGRARRLTHEGLHFSTPYSYGHDMLRLFVYERDSKPDPLLYVPNPDRVKLYLSVTKQVAREAASSELPYKIVVQKGQLPSFPQEVKNFAQEAGITIAETLKAVK